MLEQMSLRERNRVLAMRLAQATAVELFESNGYTTTTVESIAERCGISASTIYRYFGTKEDVVLWDERDPIIDEELNRRLRTQPPMEAFRDAAIAAFAQRDDEGLFLRRLKLIYAEPSIWAAAALAHRIEQGELAAAFAAVAGSEADEVIHDVVAAVCLAALDIAFDHWQRSGGTRSLADLITVTCRSSSLA